MKSIEDFKKWYKKISQQPEVVDDFKFAEELSDTPFTEYHYSLIIDNTKNIKLFTRSF